MTRRRRGLSTPKTAAWGLGKGTQHRNRVRVAGDVPPIPGDGSADSPSFGAAADRQTKGPSYLFKGELR